MNDDQKIQMKILLPNKVFAEVQGVTKIGVETHAGAYGLLPHRLDGTTGLIPGILSYETESGATNYVAVDTGILVKSGYEVLIAVRNAVGGAPLEELRSVVEEEILDLDKSEVEARSTMARLESGFIRNFQKVIDDR